MARKVIYARLQTEAYVPGAGGLGTVFPSQTKTLEGLEMTSGDGSLIMSFTYRGLKKELEIPKTNVVVMELAPEEAKKSIK